MTPLGASCEVVTPKVSALVEHCSTNHWEGIIAAHTFCVFALKEAVMANGQGVSNGVPIAAVAVTVNTTSSSNIISVPFST